MDNEGLFMACLDLNSCKINLAVLDLNQVYDKEFSNFQ